MQEFPEAYFYHVTEEFADLLSDLGYYINCCGTETTLQVGVSYIRRGQCMARCCAHVCQHTCMAAAVGKGQ
jgi:hypothetical protein